MTDEQELRRRLREIPGPPAGGLDVDAAVADARRRRRPKTAALAGATGLAAVLAIAPFAAPALLPSSTSTMAERPESDAGAPAPEVAGQESAGQPEEGSGAGDAGTGADGGSVAGACAYRALRADTGIGLRFLDDPADGLASIEIDFPAAGGDLVVEALGIAQVEAGGGPLRIVSAPDASQLAPAVSVREASTGAGGGTVVLDDVPVATDPGVGCGIEAAAVPAPLVLGTSDGRPVTAVGDPWAP
ncbi:hypothetical protein [Agrococcus terreus]|uniref:Uncharacterized protein n=1 Tax=Agrococcus terreus TaxID=574649 RepID=A0ABQ2KLS7_9MICO|nr:hypothetical protein [Agrococcus terreus]GGN87005.1 hypothetical protein GCM10010968_21100 [Agrococcus terreus]